MIAARIRRHWHDVDHGHRRDQRRYHLVYPPDLGVGDRDPRCCDGASLVVLLNAQDDDPAAGIRQRRDIGRQTALVLIAAPYGAALKSRSNASLTWLATRPATCACSITPNGVPSSISSRRERNDTIPATASHIVAVTVLALPSARPLLFS